MNAATPTPSSSSNSRVEPPQLLNTLAIVRKLMERRLWFVAFVILDIVILRGILTDSVLKEAWNFIIPGIGTTIRITLIAFVVALFVGLLTAFARMSKNVIFYNVSTFYIELFRGLPLLVIILIFAFVVTPAIVNFIVGASDGADVATVQQARFPFLDDTIQRALGVNESKIATTTLRTRDINVEWRIMFAFALTYGAFMSEVFRAGLESIGKGQLEAARSLGMTYVQSLRFILLPQAIRNVLPALVNNFVFLLKDTSLASAVAVHEISQLTQQYASNNFRYPEGLLVLSFLYANLTIVLSMGAIYLEIRLHKDRR